MTQDEYNKKRVAMAQKVQDSLLPLFAEQSELYARIKEVQDSLKKEIDELHEEGIASGIDVNQWYEEDE